jgi:hypothetical protein
MNVRSFNGKPQASFANFASAFASAFGSPLNETIDT